MTTNAEREALTLGDLLPDLERELDSAQELRARIHAFPRLSGMEADTRDLVLDALSSVAPGTDLTTRQVAGTGAVVSLNQPGTQGEPIVLRAELDALPVTEATGVPWASTVNGVMHACGHDVHLAALVCAARTLTRVGLQTPLNLILQPREETNPSGAVDVLAEYPELTQARAILAAHVQPTLRSGEIACVEGVVNASSDEFRIVITGRGGHAAYPHVSNNPVYVASQVAIAVSGATARLIDPTATAVATVTRFTAGTTTNVIPDQATIEGSVRASTSADRETLIEHLHQAANAFATASGCDAEVTVITGEPPLLNDPALAHRTAVLLAGTGISVNTTLRSAGSDDFAFYGAEAPSLMMFVGVDPDPAVAGEQRLHSAHFLPRPSAIRDVATALLAGYLAALARAQ